MSSSGSGQMSTCARCRPSRRRRPASMVGWPPPQPPQHLYQDMAGDLAMPDCACNADLPFASWISHGALYSGLPVHGRCGCADHRSRWPWRPMSQSPCPGTGPDRHCTELLRA